MGDDDAVARIEKKLAEVSESQAVHNSRLDAISESLDRIATSQDEIVKLRADSSHIIKTQDDCKKERDEIFGRLRLVEQKKPQCELACANKNRVDKLEKAMPDKARVASLEKSRFWAVTMTIGTMFGCGAGAVIYHLTRT